MFWRFTTIDVGWKLLKLLLFWCFFSVAFSFFSFSLGSIRQRRIFLIPLLRARKIVFSWSVFQLLFIPKPLAPRPNALFLEKNRWKRRLRVFWWRRARLWYLFAGASLLLLLQPVWFAAGRQARRPMMILYMDSSDSNWIWGFGEFSLFGSLYTLRRVTRNWLELEVLGELVMFWSLGFCLLYAAPFFCFFLMLLFECLYLSSGSACLDSLRDCWEIGLLGCLGSILGHMTGWTIHFQWIYWPGRAKKRNEEAILQGGEYEREGKRWTCGFKSLWVHEGTCYCFLLT